MDAATWLGLVSALAAVAAAVAAWVSRRDLLTSEASRQASEVRREESERRSESERRKFELDAAASRRSSAESLAALAKAFLEAKERERGQDRVSAISPAKQARIRFGNELLAWVDTFDRTFVHSEHWDHPDRFLEFSSYAHREFKDDGAFWLVQWMNALVGQLTMRIGGPEASQDEVSTASTQMRYVVRAWVEDPDLFKDPTST